MPYTPSEKACIHCGHTDCPGAPDFKGICPLDPMHSRARAMAMRSTLLGFKTCYLSPCTSDEMLSFEAKETFRPLELVCKPHLMHTVQVNYIRIGTSELLLSPVNGSFFAAEYIGKDMVRFPTLEIGQQMKIGLTNLSGGSIMPSEGFVLHGVVLR